MAVQKAVQMTSQEAVHMVVGVKVVWLSVVDWTLVE
jgi:hypothetical protein